MQGPGRTATVVLVHRSKVPLLAAVMYANFCAQIEPDERIYHASGVVRMLQQAATTRE